VFHLASSTKEGTAADGARKDGERTRSNAGWRGRGLAPGDL
jgi:hypothetical protein